MLGYNPWERRCIQLIAHYLNKMTWYSSFQELVCSQISILKHANLQNDSCSVSAPTISIYISTLPCILGKHHPHLCHLHSQPPPLRYNSSYVKTAVKYQSKLSVGEAQLSSRNLYCVRYLNLQYHICLRHEKYPFEILVVDQCSGGSSWFFFTPGKLKVCLSQNTFSYRSAFVQKLSCKMFTKFNAVCHYMHHCLGFECVND